jgi:RimJ/RimL family protein N-acetyltransferase
VSSAREALWLAPRTAPPLTVASFLKWHGPAVQPFLLTPAGGGPPVGYGELNLLSQDDRRHWLGHLIVDPTRRGEGCGQELTRLLVRRAFEVGGSREVTLVVFPGNLAAIRCYRAAGFSDDGFEVHDFPAYGLRAELLRMAIRRP